MQQLLVGGKKIKLNLKENKQKIQIKKKKKEKKPTKPTKNINPCVKMYITCMRDFRSWYDLNTFRAKWFHLSKNNLVVLKGTLIESKSLYSMN